MLNKVSIIGAGTMGAGIAQWFSQQNIEVELVDIDSIVLEQAKNNIYGSWQKLEEKAKFTKDEIETFISKLKFGPLYDSNQKLSLAPDSQLVIEAIVEDLDIKKNLFQALDEHCDEQTIFASNTSSLPIAALSKELSPSRKSNFIGLHFFNPATIMKLVEIIPTQDTKTELTDQLTTWFRDKNKKPALCSDSPGFIVNRVARNYYGESLRILSESGHTSDNVRRVDSVLKECGGFKMGPFELMDLIGIDINYHVTQSVWDSFNKEPRFAPHLIQKQMVDAGKLGKKTNQGFYKYE